VRSAGRASCQPESRAGPRVASTMDRAEPRRAHRPISAPGNRERLCPLPPAFRHRVALRAVGCMPAVSACRRTRRCSPGSALRVRARRGRPPRRARDRLCAAAVGTVAVPDDDRRRQGQDLGRLRAHSLGAGICLRWPCRASIPLPEQRPPGTVGPLSGDCRGLQRRRHLPRPARVRPQRARTRIAEASI
jgi:hypothetical protein